jgi:hypothetical protein
MLNATLAEQVQELVFLFVIQQQVKSHSDSSTHLLWLLATAQWPTSLSSRLLSLLYHDG